MARNREKFEEIDALDQALRSLFLSLQARVLPDSLRAPGLNGLLDQLCGASPEELGVETPGERS